MKSTPARERKLHTQVIANKNKLHIPRREAEGAVLFGCWPSLHLVFDDCCRCELQCRLYVVYVMVRPILSRSSSSTRWEAANSVAPMAVYAVNYPRFKAKEFKTLALQHGQSDGLPVPQLVYRPPVAQRHALRAKAAPCICQVCFRGGRSRLEPRGSSRCGRQIAQSPISHSAFDHASRRCCRR